MEFSSLPWLVSATQRSRATLLPGRHRASWKLRPGSSAPLLGNLGGRSGVGIWRRRRTSVVVGKRQSLWLGSSPATRVGGRRVRVPNLVLIAPVNPVTRSSSGMCAKSRTGLLVQSSWSSGYGCCLIEPRGRVPVGMPREAPRSSRRGRAFLRIALVSMVSGVYSGLLGTRPTERKWRATRAFVTRLLRAGEEGCLSDGYSREPDRRVGRSAV